MLEQIVALPLSDDEKVELVLELLKSYKFSSTQVNLPEEIGLYIKAFGMLIPDEDLAEDGREDEPHVTVLYGLHTVDPEDVRPLLEGVGPIHLELGAVSLFEREEFDVIKVDVISPDLHALNAKLRQLPNSNTFPDYKPHATIAYVKKGLGEKWVGEGNSIFKGMKATIDALVFSSRTGECETFLLTEPRAAIGNGNNQYKKDNPTKDKGTVLYHGTVKAVVSKIRSEGLISEDERDGFSDTRVFLGADKGTAIRWAHNRKGDNGKAVFFEVHVPDDQLSKLTAGYDDKIRIFPTRIPPEWLGEAFEYNDGDDWEPLKLAARKPTGYAVVFVSAEPRAAIGNGNNQYTQDNPTKAERDPLKGEAPGKHTPEAAARVINYLSKATGQKFEIYGSVSKGKTSDNDFDIVLVPPTPEEEEAASDANNQAMSDIWDKVATGELTRDEAMQQIFGDPDHDEDPLHVALKQIGFEFDREARWLGIVNHRYVNKETKHAIEIWEADSDTRYYGLVAKVLRAAIGNGNNQYKQDNPTKGDKGSGARSARLPAARPDYEAKVLENIRKRVTPHYTGPKNPTDYNDQAEKEHSDRLQQQLRDWNARTFEEYQRNVEKALTPMLKKAQPYIRMRKSQLDTVLKDGEFRNTFETGTSNAGGRTVEGDIDLGRRRAAEEALFGIPQTAPDSERPVYGYLSQDAHGRVNDSRVLDAYGNVAVRLKSDVRDSTTYSIGDSLDTEVTLWPTGLGGGFTLNNSLVPQPMSRASILAGRPEGRNFFDKKMPSKIDDLSRDYVEAQFHRRITVSDIAHVTFDKAPSAATTKRLRELGVPFSVTKHKKRPRF